MPFRSRVCALVAILVVIGNAVQAEFQGAPARLNEAASARAAGRVEEALAIVDGVLVREPSNGAAVQLKVALLIDQDRVGEALSAYDTYVTARRAPDGSLLRVIATAELRRQALDPDASISVPALERLALAGDSVARQSLQRTVAFDRPPGIEMLGALTSLARVGDARAEAALGALLATTGMRLEAVQAIQDAKARSQAPKVVGLLVDSDPVVRMAAARTLGVLQAPEAVPHLQRMFDSDLPTVRLVAAVALKRLGQSSSDAYLAGLLNSEVPEVRFMAAEAYQLSKTTQWVSRIRELAAAGNHQQRVRVADLLACCDVPLARTLLVEAMRSQNPLLRLEAARVLEEHGLGDLSVIRRLLGDTYLLVRLHGAGAALRIGQPVG